jgi:hypothetical protein
MATEYTAGLIERLRERQQELREEREKIDGALSALTAKPRRSSRPAKRGARERPAPFVLRRTPTR